MSKPLATLSPLHHRGALHIKVEIDSSNFSKALIRQVPGRQWSKTHGCWYVPYTPEAYRQLQELFQVKHTDKKTKPTAPEPQMSNPLPTIQPFESSVNENKPVDGFIRLEEENKHRMKAFVPWQRRDWIEKIKTIPGRAWNQEEKYWSLPMVKTVIGNLNDWFGVAVQYKLEMPHDIPESYTPKGWKQPSQEPISPDNNDKISLHAHQAMNEAMPHNPAPANETRPPARFKGPVYSTVERDGTMLKVVTGEVIIANRLDNDHISIYVPYDKQDWIESVKKIQGRKWNSGEKCWVLPLTLETTHELKACFEEKLHLNFTIPPGIPEKYKPFEKYPAKEREDKLNPMQRLALNALEEKLILESKRHRTIKTYKNALTGLLAFYPGVKPSQISLKQINAYIIYKRKQHQYTNSTVNNLISALNAFFGRTLNQMDKVLELQRPKKEKKLPNVLTKEEVERLLNATENPKHKCMLVMLYSAGLRKGEVLRLKVRDLNASHQCLFIKDGKGGKDRYSFYPPDAQRLVAAYIAKYKPRYWLFEGQTGGQYSETSLQIVFEKAREKSGVNPDITIHGLRHSFATHLVYDGVPLHEVKKLMGHENIETTAIYLHIANKFLSNLKSPLEGMKI